MNPRHGDSAFPTCHAAYYGKDRTSFSNVTMHERPDAEARTIAAVYEAAAGEVPWGAALQLLSELVRCRMAQFMAVDLTENRVVYSHEGGPMPAEAGVEYARRYHSIDPHIGGLMQLQSGAWYHSQDHFDDAAVASNRFYQELLIPYGSRYVSGVKLLQDETSVVVLGLHRSAEVGEFDQNDRALVERLGFHLRHAASLWSKQRVRLVNAAMGKELLDRMQSPVLLVDAELRIGVANPHATRMLREGDKGGPIRDRLGSLMCSDLKSHVLMKSVIADANLFGNRTGTCVDRAFIKAPSPHDPSAAVTLCFLALRPSETMGAFGSLPMAMVMVYDPSNRQKLDPFMIAAAYDLTPAEARVAAGLAAGESAKRIASQHGVSPSTIKSQIASLYQKLGVSSSGQLAALLNNAPFASFAGR